MSQTLCRFFANNACRFGSACQFSHDRSSRADTVCRFYLQGACTYGSRCKYDHVRPTTRSGRPQQPAAVAAVAPAPASSSSSAESGSSGGASRLRPDAPSFVPRQPPPPPPPPIAPPPPLDDGLPVGFEHISVPVADDCHHHTPPVAANKAPSYASKVGKGVEPAPVAAMEVLCPYFVMGQCWYGDNCSFIHGQECPFCFKPLLHPTDQQHNAQHRRECVADHEREMERAFESARSAQQQCGICMELVLDKTPEAHRRFGLLQNCRHCFCLECIRKWRRTHRFEAKLIRACPECRTQSDFVIPSSAWVDDEEAKARLIAVYKKNLGGKHCKYFERGRADAECPFGNKCFYRHELPDGTRVEGDSPRLVQRRLRAAEHDRRRRYGPGYVMWDFLHERNLLSDSYHSSSASYDSDDDDERLERLIDLDLADTDWADVFGAVDSDDDDSDAGADGWLARALRHDLAPTVAFVRVAGEPELVAAAAAAPPDPPPPSGSSAGSA